MPDFWDKLFKTNLSDSDPSYAVNGVSSAIYLYAIGSLSKSAAADLILDDNGDPMSVADRAEATLLLDGIDAQPGANITLAFNKVKEANKVIAVLNVVELGWTDKATAKNFLGV